jgi:hypothetical protein
MTPDEFFALVRVGEDDACWPWLGRIAKNGYGIWSVKRKMRAAHVASYVFWNGPVPEGLEVMHTCSNRACVNPHHLVAGTKSQNMRQSVAEGTHFGASKTHCKNGHPFDEENTRYDNRGGRYCKTCKYAAIAAYQERRRTNGP